MTSQLLPLDWDDVHFVVFDVDGTLYRQRPLRLGWRGTSCSIRF